MSDDIQPKTLLKMAGAIATPAAISDSVIVLIDCQKEYLSGALPLFGIETAMAQVEELISAARKAGAPIFHVRHKGQPGDAFDLEGNGAFIDGAIPQGGETIVTKTLPNAFAGTNLEEILSAIGRPQTIFGGFMTHLCVSATVRNALDLDLRSTVIASTCATRDLPDQTGSGGALKADDIHRATLAALGDRFATIAPDVNSVI
ncbi:MAG: cysteine hydrolase family protein [Rhodospirillales bacterium]